jgi:CubicO group peptidase (beta-lactamase class C family)
MIFVILATDIQNLQYLKPVSGFRTKYDYDNLYIVAGEVIHSERKSWGDFVEERIMEPLEMNHKASFVRLKDSTNIIAPHVPINGKLKLNATKTNFLMLEFIPV